MKHSNLLALGALLLTSPAIAKPMAHEHLHEHLHKRDMVIVTVTEDVLEIVNVILTVYNGGAATSTGFSTTQTTRHGIPPAASSSSSSSQPPKALPPSPSPLPPTDTKESSAKEDSAAHVDTKAKSDPSVDVESPKAGNLSPVQIQEEMNQKQNKINQAQSEANQKQEKINAEHAAKMGAPAQPAAAPVAPKQKAEAPVTQQDGTQGTSGKNEDTHKANTNKGSTGGGNTGGAGPSGGACGEIGGKCTGEITMYGDVGAGACGWKMDPMNDDYFAIAAETFGAWGNNEVSGEEPFSEIPGPGDKKNAFCGRRATISANGKQVTAHLTDKCGGCHGWDVDASTHLWNQLYPGEPTGSRHTNFEWWFTTDEIFHGQ